MSEVVETVGGKGAHAADPLWDDWDTPPRLPAVPELHLDGFDGPLDLLLDLAERQRIDLGRLSILQLIEQFVAAMERLADRVPVERRADWLVMAARLVLLRSRLCFPVSPKQKTDAEKEARRELDRIEAVRFTRVAAAWLDARPQLGRDVFARPHGPSMRLSSYMDLMEACLAVLLREEDEWVAPEVNVDAMLQVQPATLFRVGDVLKAMRQRLTTANGPTPLEEFWPAIPSGPKDQALARRAAISSTLIAALELGRQGEVLLDQDHRDAPVLVSGQPMATWSA